MNRETKLLAVIILAVLFIFGVVALTGCSSTKKSVNKFSESVKQSGFFSKDSTASKQSDSTSVKHSNSSSTSVDSSGYEKQTEETIIEWIVNDTTPTGEVKRDTKVKVTKKVIREKGTQKKIENTEKQKTQATSVQHKDTASKSLDSSGSKVSETNAITKDKKVKRLFPGWQFVVPIIFILAGLGYYFRSNIATLFPFLKRKKNDT